MDLKLKCLVYGKSGTGKTVFAAQFPKPYIFDFDGGLLSAREFGVDGDKYSDVKAFESKMDSFKKDCPYDTIVIDSISTMQEFYLRQLLRLNRRTEPTLHERGVRIFWLTSLFLGLLKLDKHLVVVAHEETTKDELTSAINTIPLVAGNKLPHALPLYFDEVYRMSVGRGSDGGPVWKMLTVGNERFIAKSRLNVLEPVEMLTEGGEPVNGYDLIMSKFKDEGGDDVLSKVQDDTGRK